MTVEWHGPLPDTNFKPGRDGMPISRIVLHTTVGWAAGAEGRFKIPSSQASAHFLVRVDGALWQFVNVWDTAYHAGDEPGGPPEPVSEENLKSVGIEHEDGGDYNGVRSDALYARSAALVAQLCKENSIPCRRGAVVNGESSTPGIYDHREISQTACPDALDTDRIIRMAAAILAPTPEPAPAPAPSPEDHSVLLPTPAPPVDVAHEWARIYAVEAPAAGIRAELALAQALHETGNFTFPHDVPASYNNPAGLGATGGAGVGNVFPTKRAGVVAHLQHILVYFKAAHTDYCFPTVDQRHYAHRGYPNDVHQFDGHWAVPGLGYGDKVLALIPQAKALLGQ